MSEDPTTPEFQIEQGNAEIARLNRRLLLLATAAAAVLVLMVGWTMWQVTQIVDDGRGAAQESAEQTRVSRELLERMRRDDENRQRIIDEAVEEIAAEQYRALVAHDHSIRAFLEEALALLDQEVNSPSNKEQSRVAPLPPWPAEPFVGPRAAPAQPAPAASPCDIAGRSGKCKKGRS